MSPPPAEAAPTPAATVTLETIMTALQELQKDLDTFKEGVRKEFELVGCRIDDVKQSTLAEAKRLLKSK